MGRSPLIVLGLASVALLAAMRPAPVVPAPSDGDQVVFEIIGSGGIVHYHNPAISKPSFKSKANKKNIPLCVMGNAAGCNDGGTLTADPGGKVYLFYDSTTQWRVATNLMGNGAFTVDGYVSNDGKFLMVGTDIMSQTQMSLAGKVKFDKTTGNATKVSGKFNAVSQVMEHTSKGGFKSVAVVTP